MEDNVARFQQSQVWLLIVQSTGLYIEGFTKLTIQTRTVANNVLSVPLIKGSTLSIVQRREQGERLKVEQRNIKKGNVNGEHMKYRAEASGS
jgi:hypothetical protein